MTDQELKKDSDMKEKLYREEFEKLKKESDEYGAPCDEEFQIIRRMISQGMDIPGIEFVRNNDAYAEDRGPDMIEYLLGEIVESPVEIANLKLRITTKGKEVGYAGNLDALANELAAKLDDFKDHPEFTEAIYPVLEFVIPLGEMKSVDDVVRFLAKVMDVDITCPFIPGKTDWLYQVPNCYSKCHNVYHFHNADGTWAYSIEETCEDSEKYYDTTTYSNDIIVFNHKPVSAYQRPGMKDRCVIDFMPDRNGRLLYNLPDIVKNEEAIILLGDSLASVRMNQHQPFADERVIFTSWWGDLEKVDLSPLVGRKVHFVLHRWRTQAERQLFINIGLKKLDVLSRNGVDCRVVATVGSLW